MGGRKKLVGLAMAGAVILAGACIGSTGEGDATGSPSSSDQTDGSVTGSPTSPSPEGNGSETPGATTSPGPGTGSPDLRKWSGTWRESSGASSGSLRIDWEHYGPSLRGTMTIDGWLCLDAGVVTGTLSGSSIEFELVQREIRLTYKGTVAGNRMSGTYSTNCDDTRGTWRARAG
jgi:hypothetical protein